MKRTSNHSEQGLFREEVLSFIRLFASEPQISPYRRGKIAFANFSLRVVAKNAPTWRNSMYSFDTRVRYSECDSNRNLTLTALVDYFQNCSSFHSEDIGAGVDFLAARGEAWFLLNWQIVIERMPKFCENVKVCTAPYDFKGFYGKRNYWLTDCDGNVCVKANSIWSCMDVINMRPKKVTQEATKAYELEEPIEMDYAPRKLRIPENLVHTVDIAVSPEMIDTNHHVNNAQYIRVAMTAFTNKSDEQGADNGNINQMLAEYKKSAKLGDVMHLYTGVEDGKFYVDMRDDENNTYAVVVLM